MAVEAVAGDREQVAQRPPAVDIDLTRFPYRTIRADAVWYRQHAATSGPWWFSSSGGRFDLPTPQGTCYLASSRPAAVREFLGPELAAHGPITESLLTGRIVSKLRLLSDVRAANLDSAAAAKFGVTRELAVMVPYGVPQAWAAKLASAFGGIITALRFTPGRHVGLALFADAGEPTGWPVDATPESAVAVAERIGIHIAPPARSTELTVIAPTSPTPGVRRGRKPR